MFKIFFNDAVTGECVMAFTWKGEPSIGIQICVRDAPRFGYIICGEPWAEGV